MKQYMHPRKLLRFPLRFLAAFLAFFLVVLGLIQYSHSLEKKTAQDQLESLQRSILRSAVHCYAVEGTYPDSLDYIQDHYGISWDKSKYIVDYEVFSSNLMPTVTVFPLKNKEASR